MAKADINKAMVLAAGFGKRLRPITLTTPKPLVPVACKTMLDRVLDLAKDAGINEAVVNIHHLGDQIITHCVMRAAPRIAISDERDQILETAGGVIKALPLLGHDPFLLLNADTFLVDDGKSRTLDRLMNAFDPAEMDILLLLCRHDDATGHSGGSDFIYRAGQAGQIERARSDDRGGLIYAGVGIFNPTIFAGSDAVPHSLNVYFDQALAGGRLHGITLENAHWYTVGTPLALEEAERRLAGGDGA